MMERHRGNNTPPIREVIARGRSSAFASKTMLSHDMCAPSLHQVKLPAGRGLGPIIIDVESARPRAHQLVDDHLRPDRVRSTRSGERQLGGRQVNRTAYAQAPTRLSSNTVLRTVVAVLVEGNVRVGAGIQGSKGHRAA